MLAGRGSAWNDGAANGAIQKLYSCFHCGVATRIQHLTADNFANIRHTRVHVLVGKCGLRVVVNSDTRQIGSKSKTTSGQVTDACVGFSHLLHPEMAIIADRLGPRPGRWWKLRRQASSRPTAHGGATRCPP